MTLNIDTLLPPEEQESEEDKKLAVGFAESFVKAVYEDLDDIKKSFFRIGFRLTEANENNYFKTLGYATIIDLAEDKFGFGKTTTYGLMQVYEFARDWKQPMQMDSRYEKYSQSQLLEMSKRGILAKNDFLKCVTPQDNVTDIKKAITIWNKYTEKHSVTPESKTVADILKLEKPKEEPQQDLLQLAETPAPEVAAPTSEEGFSRYLENEHKASSEEFVQISDDELIKRALLKGWTIRRFKIFDFYKLNPLKTNFVEFVKTVYGNHYSPRCVSDKNGLAIIREDGRSKIELPWTYVAGRISRLIETGEYLSFEEQAAYTQWKSSQDGLPVANEKPNKLTCADNENTSESDEGILQSAEDNFSGYPENAEEPPVVQKLNLKNEQARREWLDNFRSWGEWLSVPEVNKTFYRYNFVNGCALIVETGVCYLDDGRLEDDWISYAILDENHKKYDADGISHLSVIHWLTEHAEEI